MQKSKFLLSLVAAALGVQAFRTGGSGVWLTLAVIAGTVILIMGCKKS